MWTEREEGTEGGRGKKEGWVGRNRKEVESGRRHLARGRATSPNLARLRGLALASLKPPSLWVDMSSSLLEMYGLMSQV